MKRFDSVAIHVLCHFQDCRALFFRWLPPTLQQRNCQNETVPSSFSTIDRQTKMLLRAAKAGPKKMRTTVSGAGQTRIVLPSTGCPAVDDTTLIAYISLMPGPIIILFHSMKVQTVRIFLVYDKSSYWLYYPILGMKLFLTSFSQKWKVHMKSAHTK